MDRKKQQTDKCIYKIKIICNLTPWFAKTYRQFGSKSRHKMYSTKKDGMVVCRQKEKKKDEYRRRMNTTVGDLTSVFNKVRVGSDSWSWNFTWWFNLTTNTVWVPHYQISKHRSHWDYTLKCIMGGTDTKLKFSFNFCMWSG